jgi:hypothetical protein
MLQSTIHGMWVKKLIVFTTGERNFELYSSIYAIMASLVPAKEVIGTNAKECK